MSGQADLDDILSAIEKQTEAINRLVELQAVLIQVLTEDQDTEEEPFTYLNGSTAA